MGAKGTNQHNRRGVDNVKSTTGGNGEEYLLRRLKKHDAQHGTEFAAKWVNPKTDSPAGVRHRTVTYRPAPCRIGISADQAKAVLDAKPSVKVAAVLQQHGGARKKGEQVDNIKLNGGTQAAYLAARLRRDHPDSVGRR